MRIAVVGSMVADTIEQQDGTVSESLGGIAHTVSALAALSAGRHEIVPVCRLGDDCRERVERLAAGLPGVSLAGTIADRRPNPRVELSYRAAETPGERTERLTHRLPPLDAGDLAAIGEADVIVVNFISGDDCTPRAMRWIRNACRRVYLDVHSLALATRSDGSRFYRTRNDWPAWLDHADVVQCNAVEAATICAVDREGPPDGSADIGETSIGDLTARRWSRLAPEPAEGVPSVWVVTGAERGAWVAWQEGGEWRHSRAPAPSVAAAEPTGAGDAFGAGFVVAWVAGADPERATRFAVCCGTAACCSPGVPGSEGFVRAARRFAARQEG